MAPITPTHHCTEHLRKIPDRCDKSSDRLPSTGSAQRVEEGAASELLPTSSYEKLRSSDISSPASDDHMPAVAAVTSTECSRNCSARFLLQHTPAKSNHTHFHHFCLLARQPRLSDQTLCAPKSTGFATMCIHGFGSKRWNQQSRHTPLLQRTHLSLNNASSSSTTATKDAQIHSIAHYSPGTVPGNRPPGSSRTTAPPS